VFFDTAWREKGKAQEGSRITFEGKHIIIAAEVKKGDETLVLRDASGFPVCVRKP
jgi:hypothetical protein